VAKGLPFRRLAALIAIVAALAGFMLSTQTRSQTESGTAGGKLVLVANLTGAIGPATVRFVEKSIETAYERGAELLVLQMNTPGGLVTSTRDMIEDIIGSPVPVAGYVAPPGARAASAGTFIIYATHVAAMAPGTNIGAATPVQVGGGMPSLPSPTGEQDQNDQGDQSDGNQEQQDATPAEPGTAKAMNDAVAFIRSLAELRGRDAEWAEKAVRQAATLTADGAKAEGVIEIVAEDVAKLLAAVDGRTVKVGDTERTLVTANARVEQLEPDLVSKLLAIFTNPNVALILMMVGIYGLIFEFANPGTIGPGIVGIICLIIGLYSLNQLPLDYAGLALITLGVIFMTVEAFTPAFGVFGIGGIAAFVIGATMLVDTDVPAYQISWSVIAGTAIASGAILIFLIGYVLRAFRKPVRTGQAQLAGAEAEVLDWSGGEGHVWAFGERWSATGPDEFKEGDTVRIQTVDGITLRVQRQKNSR